MSLKRSIRRFADAGALSGGLDLLCGVERRRDAYIFGLKEASRAGISLHFIHFGSFPWWFCRCVSSFQAETESISSLRMLQSLAQI